MSIKLPMLIKIAENQHILIEDHELITHGEENGFWITIFEEGKERSDVALWTGNEAYEVLKTITKS
jgi:hypothetical protein